MRPVPHRALGVVAALVVAGTAIWGFVLVGSPGQRRHERMDERRIEDLQAIAAEIGDLVRDPNDRKRLKRALPATLDEVVETARRTRLTGRDPETDEPYGYRVVDDRRFELCATFTGARDAASSVFWNHPPGRHCFVIDVLDPP